MIQFLLNDRLITECELDPNLTVLNYLRGQQQRRGTKEGCASGDCGACTVTLGKVVDGQMQYQAVNSCLTLVSSLQGKQLITVEDLKQGRELHSVQQAMVDCHGSQCGYCTPGFVMSLFTLQKNSAGWDRHQAEQALAGNLCRCTGYRPIMDAAQQACEQPDADAFRANAPALVQRLQALSNNEVQIIEAAGSRCYLPKTVAQLAELYQQYPEARLVAGGTDLTLQITQQYQRLPLLIALEQIDELKVCHEDETHLYLGAAASLQHCYQFLAQHIPAFSSMLERFASLQIRNQGTLGGNISNASPIGDCAPMLLALNAHLVLQQGEKRREVPLDQFFTAYRQTVLLPGEFIRSITIAKVTVSPNFAAWKVAKRLDDDISAVFAAINLHIAEGVIVEARLAFGGMAATPKRALAAEAQLLGQPLHLSAIEKACAALSVDFQPLSDFRASADYRLQVARNLLRRYYAQASGELTITEVSRYVS
ncbi:MULTISPECIES: xanthine dehydrogenase small subunit [unclassified Pantoea]|uniref:xanthine dehydrogenase small subunit n=1 Tax=unclassified Pantoea TaxID=2630326 RepID=UPI00245357CF|nr:MULTISPECIES: xanthine dehydrogenase small subunit [unclassified Pantoea]MDR6350422.1 xanthine dehydrogenase small subunit [Pantoea sp. SORGH_AS_0659]WGK59059.1 xanthine dehydrogenase small subunit [Pantoea sp. SS70]